MPFPRSRPTDIPYILRSFNIRNCIPQNNDSNAAIESNVYIKEFLSNEKKNKSIKCPEVYKSPANSIPVIQNIVCTIDLGCKLVLRDITLKARNVEYNPNRFSAAIMRIKAPKTTALIFSSGKLVCTGAKSEDQAKQATRIFARIIQKLGFDVRPKGFKIQNMVGSCDVGKRLCLSAFSTKHAESVTYEAELFPGLIYRMANPRVVVLVFKSGKVVLTGAKFQSEINKAFENMYPILLECVPISPNIVIT